jgi:AAA+ lid domain
MSVKEGLREDLQLARLWYFEMSRVFSDRLISSHDHAWFEKNINDICF